MGDDGVAGSVGLEQTECRDTQISCTDAKSLAESPKACRPQEGLKLAAPKHPEMFGRAIRRAPHREAFMLKQGGRPEQAGRAIIARRSQGSHFGAQMTSIAINHLAEPWY
jgi:hypothetical protein